MKFNLVGRKFGRLSPIKPTHSTSGRGVYWICVCDCGRKCAVRQSNLLSGNTRSCGCLRSEHTSRPDGMGQIAYNGTRHSIREWAEITGIPRSTIHSRLRVLNWSVQEALTTPAAKRLHIGSKA